MSSIVCAWMIVGDVHCVMLCFDSDLLMNDECELVRFGGSDCDYVDLTSID